MYSMALPPQLPVLRRLADKLEGDKSIEDAASVSQQTRHRVRPHQEHEVTRSLLRGQVRLCQRIQDGGHAHVALRMALLHVPQRG